MSKLLYIGLVLMVIVSCTKYAEIEQEAKIDSYITCNYVVSTNLWVRTRFSPYLSLEQRMVNWVEEEEVEAEKKRQYNIVYQTYLQVQESLETNKCEPIGEGK